MKIWIEKLFSVLRRVQPRYDVSFKSIYITNGAIFSRSRQIDIFVRLNSNGNRIWKFPCDSLNRHSVNSRSLTRYPSVFSVVSEMKNYNAKNCIFILVLDPGDMWDVAYGTLFTNVRSCYFIQHDGWGSQSVRNHQMSLIMGEWNDDDGPVVVFTQRLCFKTIIVERYISSNTIKCAVNFSCGFCFIAFFHDEWEELGHNSSNRNNMVEPRSTLS